MTVFITTPIFYASGAPHLGHAYSGYIADTLKRYWQLRGRRVCLVTGTDEHGQKIESKAAASGTPIRGFVDRRSAGFRTLWQGLGIEADEFVRTTDAIHCRKIERIWDKLIATGDIYLGTYTGNYCVDCEQYYSAWQLEGRCCPVHRREIRVTSEPTYLFRLERYRQRLLAFYASNPDFIQPGQFRRAILHYLHQPLDDLSVSRVNTRWGVSVPNDDQHVVYVWLDALFSYLTAIEQAGGSEKSLPDTIHVIGKDILQFHGVYWLAFLLALDYPAPRQLVVHGWWTLAGAKIAKSNPAGLVKPDELARSITTDGLRYGLLKHKPLGRDGDLDPQELVQLINTDLANNLGNLVKRHVSLVNKLTGGEFRCHGLVLDAQSRSLVDRANTVLEQVDRAYGEYRLQQVCVCISELARTANAYLQRRSPWSADAGREAVEQTLAVVHGVIRLIAVIASPVLPVVCSRIRRQIGVTHSQWPQACVLGPVSVAKPENIFVRLTAVR